ncbi:MAG: phosphoribosylanthranilate isomerase [Chlorobi bacterium]|nr:phosphoribosylanthranilate isomerase [Chlorobiota bacterium]
MVRVKICCIRSVEEAVLALRYGAHALGFVSAMPSGPGILAEEEIMKILSVLPPGFSAFLLTSETGEESIGRQLDRIAPNAVQLVMPVEQQTYDILRTKYPFVKIVQVIHVENEQSVEFAIKVSGQVDAILLDSRIKAGGITVFGGTGHIHDWILSRKIVQKVTVPVFLAGGLNPGNLQQAIESVNPFAVDVCTGVRTNGRLDENKLAAFMKIALL